MSQKSNSEKSSQTTDFGHGIGAYLVGTQVVIFFTDKRKYLGRVEAVEGSQILLRHVIGIDPSGYDRTVAQMLIDTASGTFDRLEVGEGVTSAALGPYGSDWKLLDLDHADEERAHQLERLAAIEASDDLPYGKDVLNPLEKQLLLEHPKEGLQVMLNAYTAKETAKQRYSSSCWHNGNGDAFRHALWNCLMAHSVGADLAKEWGDAHENGAAQPSPLEKKMDLFNNEVGRSIKLGSTSDEDVERLAMEKVFEKVRGGALKRIVGNQLRPTDHQCEKKDA